MSDVKKLAEARAPLRSSAHVETYKGPGDRRVFIVSPAGFCRGRMLGAALHAENLGILAGGRIIVWAQNADEGTALLTMLSDAALPTMTRRDILISECLRAGAPLERGMPIDVFRRALIATNRQMNAHAPTVMPLTDEELTGLLDSIINAIEYTT